MTRRMFSQCRSMRLRSTRPGAAFPEMAETALPPEYQRILASVRAAGGPVMVRQVGEALGLDTGVRGKLEPLRGKLTKLADRSWLHKRPDGRFTVCP